MAQILLVDDEKVARSLYTDFLTGAGHSVTPVSSAAEAHEALDSQKFQVLVTDLILPKGDGLELLQSIKARSPEIEVVVITALDKVEPAVRAIKSGASDYLVKPITPETLSHAVNRALAQGALLRENESLRRHVALLEAGQRIVITLDRGTLLEAAANSFASMCGAQAVVLFVRENHDLVYAAQHGVPEDLKETVPVAVTAPVLQAVKDIERNGQEIALTLPVGFENAFLVPVYENEVLLGAVLMLFKEKINPHKVEHAAYLARHFALGLTNLGKFTEVEDLVYLDDLTHLFNSRYLELILDKEFKATNDKPFTLLFTDLDYFKSINDTHGHMVGSKLLVEVGRVLKNCVRDNDVVCRWGGDEFVVLLRGTDSGGALKVAERIRRSVEGHRFLAREGYGLSITTCIGIASYPEHASEKGSLVDFADRAMYRGKKGSRNIIYMAAKGLEATPSARHQVYVPPPPAAPADKKEP